MKQGVAAELVKAGADAVADARALAAGAQDMLPLDLPSEGLSINGKVVSFADLQGEAERRRGPGRPKGSEGRSAKELREYLLARGTDPLESMMRDLLLPLEAFAALLGCSKAEAWDRRQRLRENLAPYLHAKQAPVDDAGNAVTPSIFIQVGGQQVDATGRELPPWEAQLKTIENQPLDGSPDGKSQIEESQ